MSNARCGIVVVGHGDISTSMVDAACVIVKERRNIEGVAIDSTAPIEDSRTKIQAAITAVDQGNGVLLLTDMFGGTPSNVCMPFLERDDVEMISGVNLPMLIKLLGASETYSLEETVPFIQSYGQRHIVIASRVLKGELN